VFVVLIEKALEFFKLTIYDDSLALVESACFNDSYTMNFQLQALAKKYRIERGLLVVHDKERNSVDLSLTQGDNSLFVT